MNRRALDSLRGLAATLLACALPLLSVAAPGSYTTSNMTFTTAGQSMWSAGDSFILNETRFIGAQWATTPINLGPGHGCVDLFFFDACAGWDFLLSTNGKIGFEMGLKVDSGSVDASVVFNANAVLPDPQQIGVNQYFNLNPSSALAGGSLQTQSPTVEAYVDALLGVQATVDGAVCLIFACVDPPPATFGIGSRDNPYRQELIAFNRDGSGNIEVLGGAVPLPANFDERIPIEVSGTDVGGVTVHLPQIQASGGVSGSSITASGRDDLIALDVDLDGLLTLALGLPPLEGSLPIIPDWVEITYNLLDLEFGPALGILQDFELRPTLMVDLEFDLPVLVEGSAGPVTQLTSAWNALPDIAMTGSMTTVTPTFFIANTFTNSLGLSIDALLHLVAGSIGYDLADGLITDSFTIYELNKRFGLADIPGLYDFSFQLGGFNEYMAAAFVITVPEPDTLTLLAAALLAAGMGARRNRRGAGAPRAV